jgi:hypothetical protein
MANDIIPTENTTELQTPLRGILKNQYEYVIDDKFIRNRLLLVCLILLFIFIITPIIVCIIAVWIY